MSPSYSNLMQHHAFVIEGEAEEGIDVARAWVEKELKLKIEQNPDVIILRYGLLSVEDARAVYESAIQAPFRGSAKVLIIAASRVYHEAQNALLKLFEEPPQGTYLFLVLPTLGALLPTLRSRVQILNVGHRKSYIPDVAEEFIKATREKRSALVKKLTSGGDEEERRENREEAIAIVSGVEATLREQGVEKHKATLTDIATLRTHLYDRSAPVKMILEHLSLVLPKGLV